jgi:colicin import membrane protein
MQTPQIVIPENLANVQIYSETEKALAELRGKYENLVVDCATTAGMELAKVSRRELVTLRTGLEAKRKQLKAPALEYGKQIDSQAKRIEAEILKLETPIDAAIKAEEAKKEAEKQARLAAEQKRLADLQARVDAIRQAPLTAAGYPTASQIEASLDGLRALVIDDSFAEFREAAEAAKTNAVQLLADLHAERVAAEAEAARLKAEREALEREKAEAEAKAKAEREAAEKQLAEQRAAFEKQQAEERAKLEAERKAQEAELAEARRIAAEADRKARESRETEERKAREERDAAEAKARAEREAEEKRRADERAELERQRQAEERRARMEVLAAILEVVADETIKDKDARKQIGILAKRALRQQEPVAA